jgi:hypothetical protein
VTSPPLPPANAWTNYSPGLLRELKKKASPEEQTELTELLQFREHDELVARCKESIASPWHGPLMWLRKLTATEKYHWKEQGLQPLAPFPCGAGSIRIPFDAHNASFLT